MTKTKYNGDTVKVFVPSPFQLANDDSRHEIRIMFDFRSKLPNDSMYLSNSTLQIYHRICLIICELTLDILVCTFPMIGRQIVDQWSRRTTLEHGTYWFYSLPLPWQQTSVDVLSAYRRAGTMQTRETSGQLHKQKRKSDLFCFENPNLQLPITFDCHWARLTYF